MDEYGYYWRLIISQSTGDDRSNQKDEPLPDLVSRRVERWRSGDGWKAEQGEAVATEYPLTLYLNDEEIATLVCTPSDLHDLATGYLTAEGLLEPDEPRTLRIDEREGMAFVEVPRDLPDTLQDDLNRRFLGSCCGKSRSGFYFANDAETAGTVSADWSVDPDECLRLMDRLHESSELFTRTGGVHNAALASAGELQVIRSDIGRHNTLDKLYGHALQNDIDPNQHLIVFSGRISSEILLKVSKMNCPILVSTSAPTDLALNLADQLGITAAGFARGDTLNLYTHPDRMMESQASTTLGGADRERDRAELV